MSKLADFGVPYTTVSTSNGPVSVRGLSFSDIAHLTGRYAGFFFGLYKTFPKTAENELVADYLKREDVVAYMKTGLAEGLLTAAPALVSEIIACGADGRDDPDSIAAADRLPVGLQLEVTSAIIVATVAGFSGTGKFMEIVGPMLKEAANAAGSGSPKA